MAIKIKCYQFSNQTAFGIVDFQIPNLDLFTIQIIYYGLVKTYCLNRFMLLKKGSAHICM